MPHATATLNGKVIADADSWQFVEGNIYFPPSSLDNSLLSSSSTSATCPWKGVATYRNAIIDGEETKDVGWVYENPKEKASHIQDHIAFDKSKVQVEQSD